MNSIASSGKTQIKENKNTRTNPDQTKLKHTSALLVRTFLVGPAASSRHPVHLRSLLMWVSSSFSIFNKYSVPYPSRIQFPVTVLRQAPVVHHLEVLPLLCDPDRQAIVLDRDVLARAFGYSEWRKQCAAGSHVPPMPNSFDASRLPTVTSSEIIGGGAYSAP